MIRLLVLARRLPGWGTVAHPRAAHKITRWSQSPNRLRENNRAAPKNAESRRGSEVRAGSRDLLALPFDGD
jgi:hypothetical protein